MSDSYLMRYPTGGMNQTAPSMILRDREAAELVNARIDASTLRSRPGIRLHDLPELAGLAFQGACFFNPSQGLSQQVIGEDLSMLVVAAGGRKFSITLTDEPIANTTLTVTDVTGGDAKQTNPIYHLVWMIQAENYLIAQDGNSETWIWNGQQDAFFSTGYNVQTKEDSKLANAASMVAYAHGRVVQVVNGRQVLVGDIIHKDGTSNAANILNTTEQVYWATGSFFSPPSALGKVMAVAVLPLKNTTHGHGDLIFHCEEGMFSLDLTIFPRENWINQAITKHLSLDAASAGFYAITLYDSDQIYLTRNGLHSLRSAAQINQVGNPQRPLSERVQLYIDRDSQQLFRFASVTKSVRDNRLFCTTDHLIVDAVHRGGRGFLVLNFRPVPGEDNACWEGLWTLPGQGYLINQIVSGNFDGRERVFAFVTGKDGVVRLAEFSRSLNYDILPDGSEQVIEWQVMTRADTLGQEVSQKTLMDTAITFRRVIGQVKVSAYVRSDQTEWVLYREACLKGTAECDYGNIPSREYRLELGAPPSTVTKARWFQLLLKIEGACSLETARFKLNVDKGGESNGNIRTECVNLVPDEGDPFQFNPFSYHDL